MSGYKCPHCEYYMWEGKEFYECDVQDKVSELEKENAELRSTLQEIKEIVYEVCKICQDNVTSHCEQCFYNKILAKCIKISEVE